jgi:phenylpropionate dioxygenase-like ring-hydroxylating dioxygenase large terminal subunit
MGIKSDLRERDGFTANNWYIASLSNELEHKPIQRILYDRPYVLWRDSNGNALALPDRCLHRHTLLSMGGEVKNNNLKCPYHGWEYDQNGVVTHIPSEGPGSIPEKKICLKPIPCVEQDGAIWLWMGEGEPATKTPPWRFPKFDDSEWIHYFMITDFNGEVTDLAENFMDVPHTVFVHKGWFRSQKNQKVPTTIETKNGRVLCTYHQEKDEFTFVAKTLLNPKNKPMTHTDEFIYPNITRVDYHFGENGFIINSQCTPVGSLRSRVYTYIAYKVRFGGKMLEPIIRFYTRKVINQDVDIMINQGKSLEMDPQRSYRSTEADELHIQIERIRHFGKMNDERLLSFKISKEVSFWI